MNEFWVFRDDGSSFIEYGMDIGEIFVPKNAVVEEKEFFTIKTLTKKEEMYYEQFFQEEKNYDDFNIKANILIKNQQILSNWEQKFIFGLKKRLKKTQDISNSQKEILNNIYIKYYSNCS